MEGGRPLDYNGGILARLARVWSPCVCESVHLCMCLNICIHTQ